MNEDKIKIYDILISSIYDSGKTNFCLRYADNIHDKDTTRTISLDFKIKRVVLDNGKEIVIRLWDSQSGDYWKKLGNISMKNYKGLIFLYDITFRETFDSAKDWCIEAKRDYNNKVIAIVGNKIDREKDRKVTTEEGQNFANENNFIFYETSTLYGINVNECINSIIQKIDEKDSQNKRINLKYNVVNERPRKRICLK